MSALATAAGNEWPAAAVLIAGLVCIAAIVIALIFATAKGERRGR